MKWEITLALILCFFSMANSLSPVHQEPKNLIVNGDFSNPTLFGSGWLSQGGINGWIALPAMELGIGSTYNSNWGSTQVTELDANRDNSNTIVAQRIYGLTAGQRCTLSYSWAARTSVSYDSSSFLVMWDGILIQDGKPGDYNLHTESFQVTSDGHHDIVVFIGSGKSDGGGATISNVSLTCP